MRKTSVLLALFCALSLLVLVATVAAGSQAPGTTIQTLPSTSADTGHTPLVVLGMVILATGVVLLRRPVVVPNP